MAIVERPKIYEGSRIPSPIPTVLRTPPELEATGDIEISGGGKVTGTVTAYNRLVVGGGASLIGGDVRVARLTVEDGATFTGKVSMGQREPKVEEEKPVDPEQVIQPKAKRR